MFRAGMLVNAFVACIIMDVIDSDPRSFYGRTLPFPLVVYILYAKYLD